MNGQCCKRDSGRRAGFAASILPGVALVLLPKCPLCLAAWLGLATGVGISAAAAAHLREGVIVLCVTGLSLAGRLVWRNFWLSKRSLR